MIHQYDPDCQWLDTGACVRGAFTFFFFPLVSTLAVSSYDISEISNGQELEAGWYIRVFSSLEVSFRRSVIGPPAFVLFFLSPSMQTCNPSMGGT